jgi:hypothetical protein
VRIPRETSVSSSSTGLRLGSCRTSRQPYPAHGKRVPLEELLGREVWGQSFIADRRDVPHLNVFITMHPVLRPDDTACPGFAGGVQRAFGSNHLVHSKPTDLLTIAKRQFHLRTPRRTLNEFLEDLCCTWVTLLHLRVAKYLPRYILARPSRHARRP